MTPLTLSAYCGHVGIVDLLIDAGANAGLADRIGLTPLLVAAGTGHLPVVCRLLEAHAAVDQAKQDGATPLFIAAQEGHLQVVSRLLEAHAAVNQAKQTGATPLYIAAQEGHLPVVSRLLEAHAAVNQAMQDGAAPLLIAAHHGHLPVVCRLLEAHAAVDQATQDGATPLFIAAQQGHLGVLRALVEHGADTQTAGRWGTPAKVAHDDGHPDCAAWLRRCKAWAAIHRACDRRRGKAHILALLHGGADPNLVSAAGETPLRICQLADPAAGALPADAVATALVERAPMLWHPERHPLFPDTFRPVVVAVMLLHQHLKLRAEQLEDEQLAAEQAPEAGAEADDEDRLAVFLPHELWVLWIVPMLPRLAWAVV